MNGPVDRHDLDRFRSVIVNRIGLQFDDTKLGFLSEVLQRRLDHLGRTRDVYLDDLEQRLSSSEVSALACELTVCETYFFRNREQFQALAGVVLPERINANKTQGRLRLLSAGCASGEEAYSIAIVVRETVTDPAWDIMIRAVDVNPIALAKAAAARYSPWALRDTSLAQQRKWFSPHGHEMRLDETVRRAVRIDVGNLVRDDPDLWPVSGYDVIFCRNLLMYFAPKQMRLVVERIARSLVSGGFLFLGHTETLRDVSDAFELRHTHGTFYYQLKGNAAAATLPPVGVTISLGSLHPPISTFDETCVKTIRSATKRVAALLPPTLGGSSPRPKFAWDATPVLDLLRKERFTEALERLHNRPQESEHDPDTLLLEAALLVQSGRFAAADIACQRLIAIDEPNADAHYLLALCREHCGDPDGAGEFDRIAARLDPAFAMPRLHLGLLARRARDSRTAVRELGHALILLKREEASRILLFGGGFNRESLAALCESARRECEDRL